MNVTVRLVLIILVSGFCAVHAQSVFITTSSPAVTMPSQVGQQVILSSVKLGDSFKDSPTFDILATGTTVGSLYGEGSACAPVLTLDVLLCDSADCSGPGGTTLTQLTYMPVTRRDGEVQPYTDLSYLRFTAPLAKLNGLISRTFFTGNFALDWTLPATSPLMTDDTGQLPGVEAFLQGNDAMGYPVVVNVPKIGPVNLTNAHYLVLATTEQVAVPDFCKERQTPTTQITLLRVNTMH